MTSISNRPLFIRDYEKPEEFVPTAGSSYLYGVTSEPRSEFALAVERKSIDVNFVEIREVSSGVFETSHDMFEQIVVRRRSQLDAFITSLGAGPIYLDITGLGHSTWAPLVLAFMDANVTLRIIYLEPDTYSEIKAPDKGTIFDLSDRIDGIAPIPLFASLEDKPDQQTCFIPLLGFEGVRFSHMLNEVQPLPSKVYPIIGVPGFRPHYPIDAYLGNAAPLDKVRSARNLRYARSNCPFSLYYELEDIRLMLPNDQMKIGLIGTKPHALGAILYAIANPSQVEIVYDNVKRKAGRTSGVARCLIYGVSDFLSASRRAAA